MYFCINFRCQEGAASRAARAGPRAGGLLPRGTLEVASNGALVTIGKFDELTSISADFSVPLALSFVARGMCVSKLVSVRWH